MGDLPLIARFALIVLIGAVTLSTTLFLALLVFSGGDAGWAMGGVTAFLIAAAILTFFSAVYAVFNLLGFHVNQDPAEPKPSKEEPLHLGHD